MKEKCGNCLRMTKFWVTCTSGCPIESSGNCYIWEEDSVSIIVVHENDKCHYNPSCFLFPLKKNILLSNLKKLIRIIIGK
jgi:hypothetical protein